MPRLIWTDNALKDVQRLYRFLAGKNHDAAKRAVLAIRTQVKIIAEHPDIGKPVSEMSEAYREGPSVSVAVDTVYGTEWWVTPR